jgi:hypothetical protein
MPPPATSGPTTESRGLTMFIIDATALARDDRGERWNARGGVRWQSAVGW